MSLSQSVYERVCYSQNLLCMCLCVSFDKTVSILFRICFAHSLTVQKDKVWVCLVITVFHTLSFVPCCDCVDAFFFSLFVIFHLTANLTLSLAVSVSLQAAVEDRLKLLQEAHRDFGPSSQHFLSSESLTHFKTAHNTWINSHYHVSFISPVSSSA